MHFPAVFALVATALASPVALHPDHLHDRPALWPLYPRQSTSQSLGSHFRAPKFPTKIVKRAAGTLHDLHPRQNASSASSAKRSVGTGTVLLPRQENSTSIEFLCAEDKYGAAQVQAAADAACQHFQAGTQVGSNDYPHEFQNREDFPFTLSGPYQEFPIMDDGDVYTGSEPGPDRVVITEKCEVVGGITHTGAGGGDFLQCTKRA